MEAACGRGARQSCGRKIAPCKIPGKVVFIDDFRRNSTGKILNNNKALKGMLNGRLS